MITYIHMITRLKAKWKKKKSKIGKKEKPHAFGLEWTPTLHL